MPRRSNRAMYREAKGLPATLRPGRPVVALCAWEDYNYAASRSLRAATWTPRDEPPTPCRASLGDEKVTVWLPQGARIVLRGVAYCREKGIDPTAYNFTHVFGSHDRMNRTRIVIRLTEYPTNAQS